MVPSTEETSAASMTGQLLRLDDRREIAIYVREGVTWVADFGDGGGEPVEATTWFRTCGGRLALSHSLRRIALDSAVAIPPEMARRIESLHRGPASFARGGLAAFASGRGVPRIRQTLASLLAACFNHQDRRRANPIR